MKTIKLPGMYFALSAMLLISFSTFSAEQTASPAPAAAEKQLWTCGMHPQVILDHPGDCPICHMKLVPLRKADEASKKGDSVLVSPAAIQNMGLLTGTVLKGPLKREIRALGMIVFDETSLADVTMKFKGWAEKLYVDFVGYEVHKGDPLFDVYAPELYTAQMEYLLAKKQTEASDNLLESARTKLRFMDVSDAQISALEQSGRPQKTMRILTPRDGVVVEKNVVEGQMLEAGARIYRIADLGTIWVLAQVYEKDMPFVKLGQEAEVTVSYLPGRKYHGRVTYVYPTVDEITRTVKVRLEFHNPGYTLKPGMYVNAVLKSELAKEALLVPDMAVLRSGNANTVFVALPAGRFEPRKIVLGVRAENDMYQVLSGLKEGEKIVISGQFLLDSESQLSSALRRLQPIATDGKESLPAEQAQASAPEKPGHLEYVCPMPEHLSITYEHPGKCPLCGMTMVPIEKSYWDSLDNDGPISYYTCPMPEHADVKEAKPGKCPKCGMTLIPVREKPLPAKPSASTSSYYGCPMPEDADVIESKPGKCRKCGMDLIKKSSPSQK